MFKYMRSFVLVVLLSCGTLPGANYKDQLAIFQEKHPNTFIDLILVNMYDTYSVYTIYFYTRQDHFTRYSYSASSHTADWNVQKQTGFNPLLAQNAIPAEQTISFEQALEAARIYIDEPSIAVTGVLYNRDLSKLITEQSEYIWNISFLPDEKGSAGQADHVLIDALTGEVISVRDRFGDEIEY